jgi:hypothetical protein
MCEWEAPPINKPSHINTVTSHTYYLSTVMLLPVCTHTDLPRSPAGFLIYAGTCCSCLTQATDEHKYGMQTPVIHRRAELGWEFP